MALLDSSFYFSKYGDLMSTYKVSCRSVTVKIHGLLDLKWGRKNLNEDPRE